MSQISEMSEDQGRGYFGTNLYYNSDNEENILDSSIINDNKSKFHNSFINSFHKLYFLEYFDSAVKIK